MVITIENTSYGSLKTFARDMKALYLAQNPSPDHPVFQCYNDFLDKLEKALSESLKYE